MSIGLIAVLAELDRYGIGFNFTGDQDEVTVNCPFHDDTSPSCFVNIQKRCFKCHTAGCGENGDIISLLARYAKTSRNVVYAELEKRYDFDSDKKLVDIQLVEQYHQNLWLAKPLLKELYDRGVTDDLIRLYRLGAHDGRITIPVRNATGSVVNLRKYLPGAPGKDKMKNLPGRGEARLFPIEQLQYPTIMLCGGECKAFVAAKQLNPYNIGAVCVTAGEGNWEMKFNEKFRGKKLFVCMDIDEPGQKAAQKHCQILSRVTEWVGNIILPLDIDVYPKGDINDFCGPTLNGQLYPLLEHVTKYVPLQTLQFSDDTIPELSNLTAAIHASTTAKRITLSAVVAAMDTTPYIVPKDIKIVCDRNQTDCPMCTVFLDDKSDYTLPAESPVIIELATSPTAAQLPAIKKALAIPATCRICTFDTRTYYNVEDVRVSPQLQITNRNSDRSMQPAYCIGRGMDLNESYNLTGRMFPHPKTQQATLLMSSYETTQDALSTYQPHDMDLLGVFWPTEWTEQAIDIKLKEIYGDLSANVTHIFQRDDLHFAVDLAYHSPLFINFDGKRGIKGWVDMLIIGDSSQGKSETTKYLMQHYGLGEKVECKNATVAGLLGGLSQQGTRWFVSWGVIPTHDKRLVILEEIKGASTEIISKLTDMRSSGIAELDKIEKRKTHARTRLIWISNPRSETMKMSQYNFGIEAIMELIGAPEDVRRFDFALIVDEREIDASKLNVLKNSRPDVPHVYTSELCRSLILWAWTRNGDQIEFTPDATDAILEQATKLCEEFTERIPLVDRGSMRLKLARLSTALAARLFSCSEDYLTLVVHEAHVRYIANFLRRIYSAPIFGYGEFTKAVQITTTLIEPNVIIEAIKDTPFPKDLVNQLIAKNRIEAVDLEDWCGYDRDLASALKSTLVRKHALIRDGRAYRKSASFVDLLKQMIAEDNFPTVPEYLKQGKY